MSKPKLRFLTEDGHLAIETGVFDFFILWKNLVLGRTLFECEVLFSQSLFRNHFQAKQKDNLPKELRKL